MSIDSLMYRDIHTVNEELVNQVEPVPMPVAEVPLVILEESEAEEYFSEEDYSEGDMDVTSYLSMMSDEEEREVTSVTTVVPTLESSPPDTIEALYLAVLDRNVQLSTVVQNQSEEINYLHEAKMSAEADFELEHDRRVLMAEQARNFKAEADGLRRELVEKDRKIARMSYIHERAHRDFKRKVACHSIESGQTRHTISRDTVARIANEKHEDAVMHY